MGLAAALSFTGAAQAQDKFVPEKDAPAKDAQNNKVQHNNMQASEAPKAAASKATRVDYTGPDDAVAFARFVQRESRNHVAIVVFHAQWCGPCKQFFREAAEIGAQPGQKFKVIGVDVGPPQFNTGPYKNLVASHKVIGTPSMQFYVDGDRQYARTGLCQNTEDMGRYLRDLQRGLKGEGPSQIVAPRCTM